jgi:hypothetical protein
MLLRPLAMPTIQMSTLTIVRITTKRWRSTAVSLPRV